MRIIPTLTQTLLVLFLLTVGAERVDATDGVFEINEVCALNTGCFVGDAPGFPVTIGAQGSYRLTSNLFTGSGVNGIEAANTLHVRLDLNGFDIRGSTICSSSLSGELLASITCIGGGGIGVLGADEVRNGGVYGFETAIKARFTAPLVVERVNIFSNSKFGIDADQAGSLRVHECRVASNGSTGINGLNARGSQIVRNSVIEGNGGAGLYLRSGLAVHNTFRQNGLEGIRSNQARGALVENNHFEFNGVGIHLNHLGGYRGNVFVSNTATIAGFGVNLGANLCDGAICP